MTEKPTKAPEDPKRKVRCAFAGHRPQYLKRPEDDIKVELENAIMVAIRDGYTTFISGGAYGVDIWAAEIVTRLRERNPSLHLIAAIPFPGFEEAWAEEWKARYNALLISWFSWKKGTASKPTRSETNGWYLMRPG